MDVVLNISILYNCMISESGYEVELGKISPRIKNSRYLICKWIKKFVSQ